MKQYWTFVRRFAVTSIVSLIGTTLFANTVIWGPKLFTRGTSRPDSFAETVAIEESHRCGGKAAFTLMVDDGAVPVEAGTVLMNGRPLLTEADFNATARHFEIPVRLEPSNSLGGTLAGKPDASLRVALHRDIEEAASTPRAYRLTDRQQRFSDTIGIADPSARFAVTIEVGDNTARRRPLTFSIRVNGVEIATHRNLVGSSTVIRVPVILARANSITVDAQGEPGDVLSMSFMRQLDESACGPRVFFDTPADREIIISSDLMVTGTAVSSEDVGVTVNGHPALIDLAHAGTQADPLRWAVDLRGVDAGALRLEAKARDSRGGVGSATRDITFRPSQGALSLVAETSGGLAPFAANFIVAAHSNFLSYDFDFDGDGAFETAGLTSLPEPISHVYKVAGLYKVTVRGTSASGVIERGSTYVVVQNPFIIDRIVQRRWNELLDALATGDSERALSRISGGSQPKYRRVFNDLRSALPRIVSELPRSMGAVSIHYDWADYLVTRVQNGKTYGYHVSVVLDDEGLWRIADF